MHVANGWNPIKGSQKKTSSVVKRELKMCNVIEVKESGTLKEVANGVKCVEEDKSLRAWERDPSDFSDWALKIYFLFINLYTHMHVCVYIYLGVGVWENKKNASIYLNCHCT